MERSGHGHSASSACIRLSPAPFAVVRDVLVRNHYLHSFPGGTYLALGVFVQLRLVGALTLGAGSANSHRLVEGATSDDCLTLTRLWLEDGLPTNSASRVLGILLRTLKTNTNVKFLVTYADPGHRHLGIIYQATNWLYTGSSDATPLYDIGNGVPRHSRSVGQILGTHSVKYLQDMGIPVRTVRQLPKHRYIYFLDKRWLKRLRVPTLPYPKAEDGA